MRDTEPRLGGLTIGPKQKNVERRVVGLPDCIPVEAMKVFSAHGAVLTEERYNQLNAWLAALPGNHRFNLRRLQLSNVNYADLSFLWAVQTGDQRSAHLQREYLAVVETTHDTPYFLNLHDGDNGHTLIFGAPGAGKSFLVNFLLTFLRKYQPLTFIFDIGGSYEQLTQLFGGTYFRVRQGRPAFTVNPFTLPESGANIQFLYSFVKLLIESDGYKLESNDGLDLFAQLKNMYAIGASCRPELRLHCPLAARCCRDNPCADVSAAAPGSQQLRGC